MNTKKNYIPNFIFYLFLLVAFLLSMLLSQTYLDIKASLFLNSLFKNNLFIFQKTIAIINSRYGDWFYEITPSKIKDDDE